MIRHYDRLLIFKTDSAYSCSYSTLTLGDGSVSAAFYTSSLNRSIGNAAPGQAKLVDNNARTVYGRSVYSQIIAQLATMSADINALKEKPNKRWETVITAIITGVVGFLLARLGMG